MSSAEKGSLNTETRMRRALGLSSSHHPSRQRPESGRQRHRFVQDGEIPVVVLSGAGKSDTAGQTVNRVAELEAALGAERTALETSVRSLEEARATIQSLQTRLAHAELAFEEAVGAERRARTMAETALQEAISVARMAGKEVSAEPFASPLPQAERRSARW